MFSLKNKTAIITGGGSGIGQAIAILFAKQGADVHIIDLNADAGKETTQKIIDGGGLCRFYLCNIVNSAEVNEVFKGIANPHILINNAGIAHIGTVENTSEDDFDKVMDVNVKGVFNVLKAAIPRMKSNGGGSVLNIASVAALVGIPERFAYMSSKGAIISMTLSVAKDYLKDNIRCNSISPARIYTPFVEGFLNKNYADNKEEMKERLAKTQPIGRMGTPEEVAHLALYLCSDEAGFITGCDYPIDGGFVKLNN
jgi:2-keto-3-deoxy-L-fuconate dehydrogenase